MPVQLRCWYLQQPKGGKPFWDTKRHNDCRVIQMSTVKPIVANKQHFKESY